ncbi:hypothetical protein [Microvirga lotononidis]|uniref:Uncharacterized protein n=1 Tax=Microvirga lotononidis TaxID=864069 RepID=I4YRF5_9HYPH|nr:hypothetical protein [Microvirga lotononidis]EIM26547.1 hypothetical protein MicloDRAFT_00030960 [Microvirga lotononidis]WQO31229.1 hypothetical protein U0023_33560 [Microvirga lotononidis]
MKRASSKAIQLAAVLTFLCAGAQAQDAIRQPGQKQIGKVKPEVEPALIVMNSAGARLEGNKLVLTGIAPNSIIFADRPVRAAGHALTAHLLEEWAVGSDSFAKDPPNATVSVFEKAGTTVKDAVVTLKNPKMEGSQLTFDVAVLEGDLGNADGPASVFIDIIGLPFTPLSFAGMARRTAYRGAFYAGAAAATAGAYGYYHPYAPPYPYAPYPYRPY